MGLPTGCRRATEQAAPILPPPPAPTSATQTELRLELDPLANAKNGTPLLSGHLYGTYDPALVAVRLAWVDEAGRVVSHCELGRTLKPDAEAPVKFTLALEGGLGQRQKLVTLVAPANRPEALTEWRVATSAEFQLPTAAALPSRHQDHPAIAFEGDAPLPLRPATQQLWDASEIHGDGVAIYQPPVTGKLPSSAPDCAAWRELLMDLGYAPMAVHADALYVKSLESAGVKVLILAKTRALSEKQAGELREFARRGGVVLADSECGLYDEYGQPRALPANGPGAVGVLDNEFGLTRSSLEVSDAGGHFRGDKAGANVELRDPAQVTPLGPRSPELVAVEPGVRAAQGFAYGQTPLGANALISRSGGLGRFAYLNLDVRDYVRDRKQPSADFRLTGFTAEKYAARFGAPRGGEALRVLVGQILHEALGGPVVRVEDEKSRPARNARFEARQVGESWVLRLNDRGELSGPVAFALREKHFWYDLETGAFIGEAVSCAVPENGSLLAALPYRIETMHSRVRRTDSLGAFKVEFALEPVHGTKAQVGPHIFELECFDPEGRYLPHYSQRVEAEGGVYSAPFALGLNEPTGAYTLVARDLVSGTRASLRLVKDDAYYTKLFQTQALERGWTVSPNPNEAARCTEEGEWAVARLPVELIPTGLGLGPLPVLNATAPKPWKAEIVGLPLNTLDANPSATPYKLEVRLRALSSDLPPQGSSGVARLTLKDANGERSYDCPIPTLPAPSEVPPAPPEESAAPTPPVLPARPALPNTHPATPTTSATYPLASTVDLEESKPARRGDPTAPQLPPLPPLPAAEKSGTR